METEVIRGPKSETKAPWNKEKTIGSKPPLRIKSVWSIRTKLQVDGRQRDLAMFNLAIDSELRGCDVVTLRVEDIDRMARPSIVPRSARGKLDIPFGSN
jgi:integrase